MTTLREAVREAVEKAPEWADGAVVVVSEDGYMAIPAAYLSDISYAGSHEVIAKVQPGQDGDVYDALDDARERVIGPLARIIYAEVCGADHRPTRTALGGEIGDWLRSGEDIADWTVSDLVADWRRYEAEAEAYASEDDMTGAEL